jgi:predicted RecA/RadA family phage recombinase
MNHNGVITLPSDGSTAYVAGEIVSIKAATGQAVHTVAATGIGVVLHDVDASSTERPIDIHLFSAGGSIFVMADGSGTAITVGAAVGFANGAKVLTSGGANAVGYALEATSAADGLIRVVIA